jgi:hypothetical protein
MNLGQGKHFSIMDPKGISTVIYQVNQTVNPGENDPKITIQRLASRSQLIGESTKKTFYIEKVDSTANRIIILSFSKDRVIINNGKLLDDEVRISKKPMPLKFDTLYSEKQSEYKEIKYTPSLQRPITVIDPETTEEVKPVLYIDKTTNEVRGKCILKPFKAYFAFEVR